MILAPEPGMLLSLSTSLVPRSCGYRLPTPGLDDTRHPTGEGLAGLRPGARCRAASVSPARSPSASGRSASRPASRPRRSQPGAAGARPSYPQVRVGALQQRVCGTRVSPPRRVVACAIVSERQRFDLHDLVELRMLNFVGERDGQPERIGRRRQPDTAERLL